MGVACAVVEACGTQPARAKLMGEVSGPLEAADVLARCTRARIDVRVCDGGRKDALVKTCGGWPLCQPDGIVPRAPAC